jgi:hypothetical protein
MQNEAGLFRTAEGVDPEAMKGIAAPHAQHWEGKPKSLPSQVDFFPNIRSPLWKELLSNSYFFFGQ